MNQTPRFLDIERLLREGKLTADAIALKTMSSPAYVKLVRNQIMPQRTNIMYESPPPPKERPNPVSVALVWLSGRVVERPSGYWLDGRPVSTMALVKEANRMLAASGAEQVGPVHWRHS